MDEATTTTTTTAKLMELDKSELVRIILDNGYDMAKPTSSSSTTTDDGTTCGGNDKGSLKRKKRKTRRAQREMDMSKYSRRYVAFQLSYLGWDYHGFASQQNIDNTVEGVVFRALKETKMIGNEDTYERLQYSRCGRTDKGVSAMRNVMCLLLRSNQRPAMVDGTTTDGVPSTGVENVIYRDTEIAEGCREEMDYADIINRRLPKDIRVLSWVTAPRSFSARFNCTQRTYRYFFVRNSLDIDAMRDAGRRLIGEHNFTNFAKMDALQVHSYVRNISSFSITSVDPCATGSCDEMMYFEISGSAFLWHMVRNIAYVLFLVGMKFEDPEVVDHLLSMSSCPRKPQYPPADGLPLVLYDCKFEDVSFDDETASAPVIVVPRMNHRSKSFGQRLLEKINDVWWERRMQLSLTQSVRSHVFERYFSHASDDEQRGVLETSLPMVMHRKYTKLVDRKTEESYKEKVAAMSLSKRRKRNQTLRGEEKEKDLEEIERMSSIGG